MSPSAPGTCNLGGNFDMPHNVDLFFGHGMMSKQRYTSIQKVCNFTCGSKLEACHQPQSQECEALLSQMSDAVGDYNIYNIYGARIISFHDLAMHPHRRAGSVYSPLESAESYHCVFCNFRSSLPTLTPSVCTFTVTACAAATATTPTTTTTTTITITTITATDAALTL
jgi:hypothetical protein